MRFVWISEQTAVISLYIFNLLVFITETESVYCAVRSKSLNIIQPRIAEAWLRFQASRREICNGQIGTRGQVCFQVLKFSPVNI